SALVTVRVGKEPESKDFVAHESILTSRSEFFRRALNGNWEEAHAHIVHLPEDEPDIFGIYLNYVYTGRLHTMSVDSEELATLDHNKFRTTVNEEYNNLFCLYILAEKLQDTPTKDATFTALL
ncbi:hypothetical protein BU26DRAFT_387892, partial [Trematosphaeria pertusa]